jgi:hypothetical protein
MINLYLDDLRIGLHNGCGEAKEGREDWIIVKSTENAKLLFSLAVVENLSLDHGTEDNFIS